MTDKTLQSIIAQKVELSKLVHEALMKEKYFGYTQEDAREKILIFLSIEAGKAYYFARREHEK